MFACAGHTCTVVDNSLVVVGGEVVTAFDTQEVLLGDAWRLDLGDGGTWTEIPARVVPDPTVDAAAAGGKDKKAKDKKGKKGKAAKAVAEDAVAEAAPVFPVRTGHAGWVSSAPEVVDEKDDEAVAARTAAQEAAQEAGDSWEAPTVPVVVVFGGKTVPPPPPPAEEEEEAGGKDADADAGAEPAPEVDPAYLNDVWLLFPSSCVWVRKEAAGSAPRGRAHHTATPLGGDEVAVFGGFDGFRRLGDMHLLNQVRAHRCACTSCLVLMGLSQATWTWTEVSFTGVPPSPRCFHAATVASFPGMGDYVHGPLPLLLTYVLM